VEGTKEGDPGFELRSFGVMLQEQTGMMKTGESCRSRPDTSVPIVTPMRQIGVKLFAGPSGRRRPWNVSAGEVVLHMS
jgi:hypothetical protein